MECVVSPRPVVLRLPRLLSLSLALTSTLLPGSGVLGHTDHGYGRPWVKVDEHVTPILAEIVGELSLARCRCVAAGDLTSWSLSQAPSRPRWPAWAH